MALEYVEILDADGNPQKITTDVHDTDRNAEVVKMGFGAEDAAPTLVTPTTPFPTVLRRTSVWQGHSGSNPGYTGVTVDSGIATLIMQANSGRLLATLYNDSDATYYIGSTAGVTDGGNYKGIPLAPAQYWERAIYAGDIYVYQASGSSKHLIRGELAEVAA